jgi:hypothetical protein
VNDIDLWLCDEKFSTDSGKTTSTTDNIHPHLIAMSGYDLFKHV